MKIPPLTRIRLLVLATIAFWGILGAAAEQPNVVLCMTDDQGWGDTGYNGHPVLETPHLDQMSREGITFTRFYSAAAMCSPTRGSVYTGRHPYRMGITFAMKGMLEPDEIPITTVMKENGYTTGHFGKWHLGTLSREKGDQKRWGSFASNPQRYYCPPWERDVDDCFVTESKVPTFDPLVDPGNIKKHGVGSGGVYGNEYFIGAGKTVTENMGGDDSRVIMDRAIPFIQNAVKQEKPFFAVIWFHTPHSPVVGDPKLRKRYADQPEHAQHYYACITAMDSQVGRLRSELSRLGIDNKTLLCFCSDNGPARQGSPRHFGSNGGLKGYKLSIDEGGIRVPGLMVWPDVIKQPRTIDAPCVTTDYFPTVLDAIGADLPSDRPFDGRSLLPLVRGESKTRDKPIGFLNKDGDEAVWMTETMKLVVDKKGTHLYDIAKDPEEAKDLAAGMPEMVKTMSRDLNEWKESVLSDLKKVEN